MKDLSQLITLLLITFLGGLSVYFITKPQISNSEQLHDTTKLIYKQLKTTSNKNLYLDVVPIGLNEDNIIYASLLSRREYDTQDSIRGQIYYLDTTYYLVTKYWYKSTKMIKLIPSNEVFQHLN